MNSFEQYLAQQTPTIDFSQFLLHSIITTVLALVLVAIYRKYGNAFSNRVLFSKNFVLLALTTMLVITIVKSSLALSLGLVGALSIVRFRSAIKEPEELIFLFLCIGIGLGIGAHQILVTTIAIGFIAFYFIIKGYFTRNKDTENNLMLILSGQNIDLTQITGILETHATAIELKRFEESKKQTELTFKLKLANIKSLDALKKEIQASYDADIRFLDVHGLS